MKPVGFPDVLDSNSRKAVTIYFVTSPNLAKRWKTDLDGFIPVKEVVSPNKINAFGTGDAIAVVAIADVTGLVPWTQYIPVYIDSAATVPWQTNDNGYIPINNTGVSSGGGSPPGTTSLDFGATENSMYIPLITSGFL